MLKVSFGRQKIIGISKSTENGNRSRRSHNEDAWLRTLKSEETEHASRRTNATTKLCGNIVAPNKFSHGMRAFTKDRGGPEPTPTGWVGQR